MSKGNLFLGQARGSVGDVTFTHIAGVQVARARNRAPRNPRVPSQMLQRIVLNTASKAYSAMQAIVDHSFEGINGRGRNQQRFMQLNTSALRDKLADVIADPTEINALMSTALSYSFKGDFHPQLNPYIISEGTLPRQVVECPSASPANFFLRLPVNMGADFSYQDVIDAGDFQPGDQLTFIGLGHQYGIENSDQADSFYFARVILEPAGGDFDVNFVDSETDSVADPNAKNEGQVRLELGNDAAGHYIKFWFPSVGNDVSEERPSLVGAAVILSRFESGSWRRSPQSIVLTKFGGSLPVLNEGTFGAAYASYLTGDSSNLYLNGSPVAVAASSAVVPANVTSVTVDDAAVESGSVQQGATGVEIKVDGTNLTSQNVRLVNAAGSNTITPDVVTSTEIFFAFGVPNDTVYRLMVNDEVYAVFVGTPS